MLFKAKPDWGIKLNPIKHLPEHERYDDVGPVGGHVVDDEQRERCHRRQKLKKSIYN